MSGGPGVPGNSGWHVRILSQLVNVFPGDFRARYGESFQLTIQSAALEPRYRGFYGRLRLWRWVVADVMRSAVAEWRDELARPQRARVPESIERP